jgi:ERCC4-type nuclease
MPLPPIELDLPLGDAQDTELSARRRHHLAALPGVDDTLAVRLERAFPTLAALYSATEDRLADVAGPVTAARIRWFLDAPLRPPVPVRRGATGWRHAA